jgi:hypothetical protein
MLKLGVWLAVAVAVAVLALVSLSSSVTHRALQPVRSMMWYPALYEPYDDDGSSSEGGDNESEEEQVPPPPLPPISSPTSSATGGRRPSAPPSLPPCPPLLEEAQRLGLQLGPAGPLYSRVEHHHFLDHEVNHLRYLPPQEPQVRVPGAPCAWVYWCKRVAHRDGPLTLIRTLHAARATLGTEPSLGQGLVLDARAVCSQVSCGDVVVRWYVVCGYVHDVRACLFGRR